MALNVLQEAEKAYESLTDRLAKYDTFVGKYDPTVGGAPSFAGRPAGYNPVDTLRDAESLSMTLGRNRGDIESERLAALDRIAKLQPEKPQEEVLSPKDRLSLEIQARKEGMEIYKTPEGILSVRRKGESDTGEYKAPGIVDQIKSLPTVGERNQAVAIKDIMDVVDSAIKKAEKVPTGPLSALQAQLSKNLPGGPNKTAQLEKDLAEILRTIRKESTGVAFSPQEIKDLEREIPTIYQQEGNVADSLRRLKGRMLQKLNNLGVDVSDAMSKETSTGTSSDINNDPLGLGI